jgi:hypothetical protein
MTAKHTPGPWEVQPTSRAGNGSKWRDIVSMGGEFSPAYVGEALEQDANIIAAAPELMAALIATDAAMREHPCGDCRSDEDIALARAAIAKAEGRA